MARAADPMKKVIKATLALAKTKGWSDTSLADIATKSKVSLGELRGLVRDKTQILERFQEQVDMEVLDSLDPELASEPVRDRLLEVLMQRFEVLAPHKDALRRISQDLKSSALERLALIGPGIRSMDWMIAGAGAGTKGLKGAVQVNGLACIYVSVFQIWLDDDDPGLARTMAALDQKLRRGETWLNNAKVPITMGQTLIQVARNFCKARREAADNKDAGPAPNGT